MLLKKIFNKLKFLCMIKGLRRRGVHIPKSSVVSGSTFEGNNVIKTDSIIIDSEIGFGTYIGARNKIYKTSIGKFCSIAPDVQIIFGSHPTKKFVSLHPAFFSTRSQAGFTFVDTDKFEEFKYADNKFFVQIGNDVWIGQNVLIMEGVKIGDGAIVGAGAIVTRDIEPYSINVGVPAKKIGSRFDDESIEKLQRIKWWNKDIKWIMANSDCFDDIGLFLNNFSKDN